MCFVTLPRKQRMAGPLVLQLPENRLYTRVLLVDPVRPSSWKVQTAQLREVPLSAPGVAEVFLQDTVVSQKQEADLILVSVAQDEDGQHRFVNLALAAKQIDGSELPLLPEEEAKELRSNSGALLLYARPQPAEMPRGAAPTRGRCELCPKTTIWAQNYSVIPDLCLGETQKLILCDEATLCRRLPEERIFEHLRLIVNCHESKPDMSKYVIGSCGTENRPHVICQAVHTWNTQKAKELNRTNDEMQLAMWEALQDGTVAVHCLAGIHRAACIVVCHFLWRHYVLGREDVPADAPTIYARLKAVRPAVSPAYTHILRMYETYLRGGGGAWSRPKGA